MNNRYYDSNDVKAWNSPKEELLYILSTMEVYVISAHGWYFPTNVVEVCKTYEDALATLGFNTQNEYEAYVNNANTNNEGFWYYRIERVDLKDLAEKVVKDTIQNTIYEEAEKIAEKSEKRIRFYSNIALNNFKENLEKNFSSWLDMCTDTRDKSHEI